MEQLGLSKPTVMSIGGILPVMNLSDMMEENRRKAELGQKTPLIQGLASHVRKMWSQAERAKQNTVQERMLSNVRARRGEYDPHVLAQIREQGSSEIYMMLTSVKCRAAASWLVDMLLGVKDEKPWTISPTPIADLGPEEVAQIKQRATAMVAQLINTTGQMPPQDKVREMLSQMRDEAMSKRQDEARKKAERMELKMEDQLVEGGFQDALSEFIDDLTTFPSAIMKGPVLRKRPRIRWKDDNTLDFSEEIELEWERVDPFMCYPSPQSSGIDDGYFIERHRMHRSELEALKGVEGYDESAIIAVLEAYGDGGLHEWLMVDSSKAEAEGKSTYSLMDNPEGLIDALQFWGSVQGQMLLDWGLDEAEITDPTKEYNVECWLIGDWIIKATLNYHPEGKKPYYKASWEEIPGSFWGNSVADLCADTSAMCNAAARALANNMGLASGPQVAINVDRLPAGEEITQMHPWKIWQTTSDPMGNSGKAIEFFQPDSNVQQLMAVFEKFSILADEYTGIPRYMTGDSPVGGVGRTASGISMMMSNASKSIKRVVSVIDTKVLKPMLQRLYFHNMKYGEDPDLKGDANIVVRGAMGIAMKESAQQRRNEFMATISSNPMFSQIVGMEGMANLLREAAKALDMNVDKLVPSPERMRMNQMQQMLMMGGMPGMGGAGPSQSGQTLQDGAPVTDQFSPPQR